MSINPSRTADLEVNLSPTELLLYADSIKAFSAKAARRVVQADMWWRTQCCEYLWLIDELRMSGHRHGSHLASTELVSWSE